MEIATSEKRCAFSLTFDVGFRTFAQRSALNVNEVIAKRLGFAPDPE
jgi:hypothetical protein